MQDFITHNEYLTGNRANSLINRKMIFRILGILLFIEGGLFLLCAGVSLCYQEHSYIYFLYSTLLAAAVGCVLLFLGRNAENKLSRRDGYCIVAFTWLLFTTFGMLPFYLSGEIPSVTDAFFETMSGFTTTGATILDDIESLSYGMLFWRSFSQWIGGLGIVFLAIFMVLSGINFSLYFMCLKGKFFNLFKDDECRWFLMSVGIVTLLITVPLVMQNHYGWEEAFRKAFFQVASIHTSCGFATDDYNVWPHFTWMLLIYTMFAGGCTGSTGGGIKNMRLLILFRNMKNEFSRLIHPRAVLPVKVNQQALSLSTISTVNTFILLYLICIFVGWVALMFMGLELTESFGLVVSSLGNVGPGLGAYGPAFSWSALPDLAKWLLSFMMLIGRLELFGILLMFSPGFWHKR